MHSSRMRTARFSGRLRGMSAQGGMSAQIGGVCPVGVSAPACLPQPPPCGEQNDRRV